MIYSICKFNVEYEPKYSRLNERSQKYIADDQSVIPDFKLEISDADIDAHIAKYPMTKDLAEYVVAGVEFYKKVISKGAFFLHSAALCVDGKGYVFTGPCGAGKSTHASLWRKHFGDKVISVNDDKPAVRFFDGVPHICGTPFSGKFDINTNICVPLCGISILSQSPVNSIIRVNAAQAMSVLMEQTLRPDNAADTIALFDMFDRLLTTVPVYKFSCNISDEAVETSYNIMRKG